MSGKLLANAIIFGILTLLGKPWLYGLWIVSYLTTFTLFIRIRSIAEHACTAMDLNPFKNTRTTLANPIARLTVAPQRVNYHLEHHILLNVPYFNLPRMHSLLKERGALAGAHIASEYLEMLRLVTTGRI